MRRAPAALGIAVSCLCGCGPPRGHAPGQNSDKPDSVGGAATPDCNSPATAPAQKLLRPSPNAIPGRYLIALLKSVRDVEGIAQQLAQKYGGRVTTVYTAVVHGFAMTVDDDKVPLLTQEPAICYIEQDASVSSGPY